MMTCSVSSCGLTFLIAVGGGVGLAAEVVDAAAVDADFLKANFFFLSVVVEGLLADGCWAVVESQESWSNSFVISPFNSFIV